MVLQPNGDEQVKTASLRDLHRVLCPNVTAVHTVGICVPQTEVTAIKLREAGTYEI